MKFLLTLLFIYVPALVFYLFLGVVVLAYLKQNGYLNRFCKNKKTPNSDELEVQDDEKED